MTNAPPYVEPAAHDGFRSVRLIVGRGHIGLATTAYSYLLPDDEKIEVARRIAALWNLHLGEPTNELEGRAAKALRTLVEARR